MTPQKKISFPLPDPQSRCHRLLFTVPVADIAYVVMVVEGHSRVGVPRTINQCSGLMELLTPPDKRREAEDLIDALVEELSLKRITPRNEEGW